MKLPGQRSVALRARCHLPPRAHENNDGDLLGIISWACFGIYCQAYLLKLKFGHRLTLAKFRCRSNYLPIANFEQFNNPYFVPECPFCHNDYADEEHYLLYCPNFNEQRAFLSLSFPDLDENPCPIKHILCTESEDILIEIAKFCRKFMDALKNHRCNTAAT